MQTLSGNYMCKNWKNNCNFTVQVPALSDAKAKDKLRSAIRGHCETCFTNLNEVVNARRVQQNEKRSVQRQNVSIKSYYKRKQEIEAGEMKAKIKGPPENIECSVCHKKFATEDAKKNEIGRAHV